MALPKPIPLRPADRPETWDEYVARRSSIAQWRQIGDFVVRGHFGSVAEFALLAPYRQPLLPRFVPFATLLPGGRLTLKGVPIRWDHETD